MSYTKLRMSVLFAALMTLFIAATPFVVDAAEPVVDEESITLAPTMNKFQVDAGRTVSDELTVLNTGTKAFDFIVYGRPYQVENFTYEPSYEAPKDNEEWNSDAYKWLRLEQTNWHLEPGKSVKVPYTITVPASAAPGGHYGVIFVETKGKADGQAVARNKRLGTLLLATVNGEYQMGGQFKGTKISSLQFKSPLETSTQVENSGNSDFPATLTLRVSDVFGQMKFAERKEFNIFPTTTREMAMNWQDSPWFGLYKVNVETSYLDQTHAENSFVLIMPRWMIVVLVVAILAGGVYVLRRRK